jgi:hypothetical protein
VGTIICGRTDVREGQGGILVARSVLVLLLGTNDGGPVDLYQDLQGRTAQAAARAAGIDVEVVSALLFGGRPVSAVAGRRPALSREGLTSRLCVQGTFGGDA